MNKVSVIEKPQTIQIGKEPVVLVPFKLWQKMEDYFEDKEASSSNKYLRRIQKARKDIAKRKFVFPFR